MSSKKVWCIISSKLKIFSHFIFPQSHILGIVNFESETPVTLLLKFVFGLVDFQTSIKNPPLFFLGFLRYIYEYKNNYALMKPILIVENNINPLKENFQGSGSKKEYVLEGIFTEFNKKNRNDRIYTADKFLPCLKELNERIQTMGVVYGEFDHPDVFDTSLSRASHIIKGAKYIKESNRVDGQIKLLNTYWGKEAKSLVDDGCPVFVSSRAAGVTESDGTVTLKKLFTYDIVADPGFASAKMNSINESVGFSNKTNFRIYEMSDESKINDLFKMNKNDYVTKQQLSDYSKYLVTEIATTKKAAKTALKTGNLHPKKLEQLLEYYEELNKTNSQMVKYLDYLADKVQVVVNENKSLKSTAKKLISHNDYLAENLEKAINYSEYVAESVDKNISYTQYLAENLDKNISYSEYVAENVDKNITYSNYLAENLDKNIAYGEYIAENLDKNIAYGEYIAENLDKNIAYSEYIAENLDKNIAYSEYIAESLDKNIAYSEYIAENLDSTIAYSEYLAEHVEGNIAYSEYIAENLDDNIAYSEYLAESLDKTVSYAGMITEKLNRGRIYENMGGMGELPSPEDVGFENVEEEEEKMMMMRSAQSRPEMGMGPYEEEVEEEGYDTYDSETEEMDEEGEKINFTGESDTQLSKQIDLLILEAKKRKVSETNDLHFLKFLNKSQVNSFYNLTRDEQEQVKLYINERSYFTGSEVLTMIQEALSAKNESLEDKLIRLMPDNIKPQWSELSDSSKRSILSQARLYPDLTNESKIENFWLTRSLLKKQPSTKKLVSHNTLIQEDKLSNDEMKSILERFKTL